MDLSYASTPFIAWLSAGILKFLINTVKSRKLAFKQIGYGGLPSNHTCIVVSMSSLIALKEGYSSPVFGVALCFSFIVILDAASLRIQIGKQARVINLLLSDSQQDLSLRERIGHSRIEIFSGVILGMLVAWLINAWFPLL